VQGKKVKAFCGFFHTYTQLVLHLPKQKMQNQQLQSAARSSDLSEIIISTELCKMDDGECQGQQ